jgi:hypothetical protein
MSGSDGATLEGMYHEEHALPPFVHARSRDQLRIPSVILKGETPVIYFYTDRPLNVRVNVKFPRGIWTQWYPQAQIVGPQFAQARSPMGLRDGRILWCAEVDPNPDWKGWMPPPGTSADALWNYARDVDAAYVRTPDHTSEVERMETDRFLFYRGLGEATLPLRFSADSQGTLESARSDRHGARDVFVLRVEGGKGAFAHRPGVSPGAKLTNVIPTMQGAKPLEDFVAEIGTQLEQSLTECGLYPKEARAMVNTWRTSYFRTEGIRALVILPQNWTDEFIPLTVTPQPKETVRVMVGRLELLTSAREQQAETAIRDLASADAKVRERAFKFLRDQGRYVEPVIRRIMRTTADDRTRVLCRQLLATDFVTELRAAVHAAADGKRLHEDPAYIRAQLACLLREVGRDSEAKTEAKTALKMLGAQTQFPLNNSDARGQVRAWARAREGLGDDRGAADGYARFIQFGSQIATTQDCRGCHRDAGPREMSWFRDWWAGRKYATYASQTMGLERAIAEQASTISRNPEDVAARMKLAYLAELKGDRGRVEALWAAIEGKSTPAVAVNDPKANASKLP